MHWIRQYRVYVISGVVLTTVLILWSLLSGGKQYDDPVIVQVQREGFQVKVVTSGELRAKNSTDIRGPTSGLRQAEIWRVKISDLIPEGTRVEKGDFVASLDRGKVSSKLKEFKSELQQARSKYLQAKLDTAMTLKQARNNLIDLEYQLQEKKIELKQAKYEPPATKRKLRIQRDKAKRKYQQSMEEYKLKKEQAEAKMLEKSAKLSQTKRKYQLIKKLISKFKIKAPEDGMVIYDREHDGEKKGVGDNISPWDPTVATLPDLSEMISKTYVNEVDISKIEEGQSVEISVDAFPDRQYSGKVTQVANVGEDLEDFNAKVFEVRIELSETDSVLRPGMTTRNEIITATRDSVLTVPLECLHSTDTTTYVYRASGLDPQKQEVKVGLTNENKALIEEGLKAGQQVYLSTPRKAENSELIPLTTDKKSSDTTQPS